jgi:hypothetical protein
MATYRNLDRISPFSNSNVSLGQSKIAELLSKKLVWLGADSDHNKHHPPQQASNKPAKNDLKTTFAAKPNEIAPSSDPNSAFEISSTCSSIPFGITDIDLELFTSSFIKIPYYLKPLPQLSLSY